ncbi:MAG TPA: regulatory protein RecX [Egibacteraceae bacterium]
MSRGAPSETAAEGRRGRQAPLGIPGVTRGVPAPRAARGAGGAVPDAASAAPPDTASGEPAAPALSDEVKAALAYLLKSTAQRPQTEAELRDKLRRRDVDDDVSDAAIAEAKRLRAVDDAAFARAWVEDRGRARGFGTARLRAELRRRQVPDELIDEALHRLDGRDDLAVATELAAKRAATLPASLPPETVARRLVAYLVRRGHPPALAQRAAITASGLDREWD